jgi:hypothetical protein
MDWNMNYKEHMYKNALNQIEKIYKESKYDESIDLYRSFDIINSVNDNQVASKEWLVEKLMPFIKHDVLKRVAILGSWYGLLGMILRHHVSEDVIIRNIDSDPISKEIGHTFVRDNSIYRNNLFEVDDAVLYLTGKSSMYQIIINTSCEHMEPEDIQFILRSKSKNSLICFQSNNYHSVQSHINTHNSLEEFEASLNLIDVYHSEVLKTNEYERYMVIGI